MNNFIRFTLIFLIIALGTFGFLIATNIVSFNKETQEALVRVVAAVAVVGLTGFAVFALAKGPEQKK